MTRVMSWIRRLPMLVLLLALLRAWELATPQSVSAQKGLVLLAPEKGSNHVSVFDPLAGKLLYRLDVNAGPHEVRSSTDLQTVVVSNYGKEKPGHSIGVIDVPGKKVVRTISTGRYGRPHDMAFLPGDTRVVVTTEEPGALLVVDLTEARVVETIATKQRRSHMVALSPDASRAYVTNVQSGSVSVIDLAKKRLIEIVPTGAGAEGVAYVSTTDEIWVTNRVADTVSVIDAKKLTVVATIPTPKFPIRAVFVPTQNLVLVSAAQSDTLYVLDVTTRSIRRTIAMPGMPTKPVTTRARLFGDSFSKGAAPIGILITPDGRYAYVANSYADVISVLDLKSWKVERLIEASREPDGLAWGRP